MKQKVCGRRLCWLVLAVLPFATLLDAAAVLAVVHDRCVAAFNVAHGTADAAMWAYLVASARAMTKAHLG